MPAGVGAENMGHDVAVVDQDPLPRRCAFGAEGKDALDGKGAVDVVRDSTDLTISFRGTQDEVICNGGQLGDRKHQDVIGLLLKGRLGNSERSSLRRWYDRDPPDTAQAALYKIRLGPATKLPRRGQT